MGKTIWLASYPKSGNTWTRNLISHARAPHQEEITINSLQGTRGISSARMPFDAHTLLPSGIMSNAEIEDLRPEVHRHMAIDPPKEPNVDEEEFAAPFQKTHDAYTFNEANDPILGGAEAAKLAILIVRDPRAVAPSLANHMGTDIDTAILNMANPKFSFAGGRRDQNNQLRQRLLTWGGFQKSWMEQNDIPVHMVRYEDLSHAPVETLMHMLDVAGQAVARDVAEYAVDMSSFQKLTAQEAESGFKEAPKGRTFFRKGKADAWREELTAEQIARLETDHAEMMEKLGYEPVSR